MILVNIGCGSMFHPAWVNLDSNPVDPAVRRWDVRRGLPFGDGEVDACYASHVLEHLPRDRALLLLAECRRALRSGGILRLVVPDLEAIARHYLRLLEEADHGSRAAEADYDWVLLELFDQMVRTDPGGAMHRYLTGGRVTNPQFVISRAGMDAERLILGHNSEPAKKTASRPRLPYYWRRVAEEVAAKFSALLLGPEAGDAMKEGLFRRSGQVHLWMYDRFSLRRLLEQVGFREVRRCEANQSWIPDFTQFELETLGGRVRKPDSLFVEGINS